MKNCCLVLLALLPLTAAAYPTELEKQMNGAEVSATVQQIDSNIGGLTLYNYGLTDAKCNAQFRNGPEAPRTRKVEGPAGRFRNATTKLNRRIIRPRIGRTCVAK